MKFLLLRHLVIPMVASSMSAHAGCDFILTWWGHHSGDAYFLPCYWQYDDTCDLVIPETDSLLVHVAVSCPPATFTWYRNGIPFLTTTGGSSWVFVNEPGQYNVIENSADIPWATKVWSLEMTSTPTGIGISEADPPSPSWYIAFDPQTGNLIGSLPVQLSTHAQLRIFSIDGRAIWNEAIELRPEDERFEITVGRLPEDVVIVQLLASDFFYSTKLVPIGH